MLREDFEWITFSPMASCMMHMWSVIPVMTFPLVKSVSKAPTSWLRTALRKANLNLHTCLSLAYIQQPISALINNTYIF